MSQTIVSTKYQVLIPKDQRKQVAIKPGQYVSVKAIGPNKIVINTSPAIDQFVGLLKGNEDPVRYQKRIRKDKKYS